MQAWLGGRNREGFSPDTYITGVAFATTIRGIQSVVTQSCTKHFIGNERETQQNPSTTPNGTIIEAISSNIDDRTTHELYLWPFTDAVRAGVSSYHVQLQPSQQDLCLREFEDPKWAPEKTPRLRHVRLGSYHSGLPSIDAGNASPT
jgi:beta-glucosidase-like glycosyl hydrolase